MAMFLRQALQRSSTSFSTSRLARGPYGCSIGFPGRCFGAAPNKNNDSDSHKPTSFQDQAHNLLETSTTGTGQVIFLNSSYSGKILLASLFVGDPFTATMAALGTTTSTITAQSVMKLDETTTHNGLLSYNGCLVGCATAVFIAPHSALSIPITVVGAAASTAVTQILSKTVQQPQWTIAFNLVTLTALLRVQPLSSTTTGSDEIAATAAAAATVPTSTLDVLLSPLTGLSQIFVVQSAVSGAGIVAAIATYSPQLAAHAVIGSLTGTLVGGAVYGAPAADLAAGLWGFNAALTSMGVAVFFVPTVQSNVLSVAGAAATASVFGALSTVFGTVLGCPCLTLPFCITMSGCYLLGSSSKDSKPTVPGLLLAENPHSPEKNALK